MEIDRTATITLTEENVVDAICRFVEESYLGGGLIVDPETVTLIHAGHKHFRGRLEVVCRSKP